MNHDPGLIWTLIGKNKFCSFKYKLSTDKFLCKNKFNLVGYCSKKFCPLSNNNYATVIEKNGNLFLYYKKSSYTNFPSKMWKKIRLSRNLIKAIQQIDLNLVLWPHFFVIKTKLRLIKLIQFLIRSKMKYNNLGVKFKFKILNNVPDTIQLFEKATCEKLVEEELLNRLHMGVYGKMYAYKHFSYIEEIKKKSMDSYLVQKNFYKIIA
ncbi:maintenance of killer 16, mak16-like protein (nucleomorph) [Cryptomonas paramecium]|uniref:Maintenance of killer 16, mak16-like protein n=1 Tax=Cryptomonas paramaecium TaxID=2898 RepID=F2HHS0_9CRYP|nr:maintenance of killer 16, mak16-like protein [Cryptomonas paramecium]AEA38866.1 maintenance of killer 16, mak16-like protein [Cryptomonas paramecium]|mmetsp:Transcript_36629/g.96492  ORF Transcript_36629/g.96492 Transcript_36629/m.96492 type:complete len:208 (-) Transcript_36629:6429-7052(-)